jgi:hypothetical protein
MTSCWTHLAYTFGRETNGSTATLDQWRMRAAFFGFFLSLLDFLTKVEQIMRSSDVRNKLAKLLAKSFWVRDHQENEVLEVL